MGLFVSRSRQNGILCWRKANYVHGLTFKVFIGIGESDFNDRSLYKLIPLNWQVHFMAVCVILCLIQIVLRQCKAQLF